MTTKLKTRKPPKLDLDALIGPLDQKEEPKTLEECFHEAGGFPFVARAIVGVPDSPIPEGQERRFICRIADTPLRFPPGDGRCMVVEGILGIHIDPDCPRWTLVGHRT